MEGRLGGVCVGVAREGGGLDGRGGSVGTRLHQRWSVDNIPVRCHLHSVWLAKSQHTGTLCNILHELLLVTVVKLPWLTCMNYR